MAGIKEIKILSSLPSVITLPLSIDKSLLFSIDEITLPIIDLDLINVLELS